MLDKKLITEALKELYLSERVIRKKLEKLKNIETRVLQKEI